MRTRMMPVSGNPSPTSMINFWLAGITSTSGETAGTAGRSFTGFHAYLAPWYAHFVCTPCPVTKSLKYALPGFSENFSFSAFNTSSTDNPSFCTFSRVRFTAAAYFASKRSVNPRMLSP